MTDLIVVNGVEDAHADMVSRVASYYERYTASMWSVVVLESRTLLGDELWPDSMDVFKEAYVEHVGFEAKLCRVLSREDSMDVRYALGELHKKLEHDITMELLAQRTMKVETARSLQRWSQYRIRRHAEMRKKIRFDLDVGFLHMSNIAIKQERNFNGIDVERDSVETVRLLQSIRPSPLH